MLSRGPRSVRFLKGVRDGAETVEQKLQIAADPYGFMTNGFYQSRAVLLELMIVIILTIDLAFLFRSKQRPEPLLRYDQCLISDLSIQK